MKRMIMKTVFAAMPLFACFAAPAAAQDNLPNGLYARFDTTKGVIITELFFKQTPVTVANFVGLAEGTIDNQYKKPGEPYYDGITFHRVIADFMIQGGDPTGTGGGGPDYSIKGEFAQNGVNNPLSHARGVLSMARSNDFDSAGSQFFIVHGDSEMLDGAYAAFGKVVEGMDAVDKIAETPNSGPNGAVAPENMPAMQSVTIDSDAEVPEPDKLG